MLEERMERRVLFEAAFLHRFRYSHEVGVYHAARADGHVPYFAVADDAVRQSYAFLARCECRVRVCIP